MECFSGHSADSAQPIESVEPRDYEAAQLLGLRFRNLPGARISVSCECCVLSGRGLCVGLIAPQEESYRASYVWV